MRVGRGVSVLFADFSLYLGRKWVETGDLGTVSTTIHFLRTGPSVGSVLPLSSRQENKTAILENRDGAA